MKRIIALLILVPSVLEAGLGWSQPPIEVKQALMTIDLFYKGTEDNFFSAIVRYKIDNQGKPIDTIEARVPYKYNVTGGLTDISDGKANIEYAVTKTKDDQEIVLQAKKLVTLSLRRKAMTRYEEEVKDSDENPFLLRIDVYHSNNDTWDKN